MSKKANRATVPSTRGILIRWPSWYDKLNRLNFLGRESQFREKTVDLADVARGHRILDVGCGTGELTMAVKLRTGEDGEVHGIDGSPEMIREAERKAAEKQLDVRYQVGVIEDIPFPDSRFDVVVSSLMFHHLPRDLKQQGVAEISRVLKPGGGFLAVDIDPPLWGNLRTINEAMMANGFTEMRRGMMNFRTMFIPIHFLRGKATKRRPM